MTTSTGVAHGHDEFLHEFMLAAADTTPHSPAVVEFRSDDDVHTVSCEELRRRTDDYAAVLAGLGLDIGDRVVLESNTSASAVASFLACSRLGLPFVPVSPDIPAQRLQSIVETTEPALFLRAGGEPKPGTPAGAGLGRFGEDGLEIDRLPSRRIRHRREIVGSDTAYMIFTSGTTGRPKGVVMSHRGVVSFYRGMLAHRIVGPGDRVATTSPLQFDFSLLDIGLALGSGAAVVPVPRELLRWPSRFLSVLRETGATQVNGVPSIWRPVLRHFAGKLSELAGIRGILFCGEEFPLDEVRRLQSALPHARLINCYGATESMACSFTEVPNPLPGHAERLSIGFAHPGAEMMLVGDRGELIEDEDVPGEIHLRSPALFTGYWADPEATAAALVPDPAEPRSGQKVLRSGDLAFRGRNGEFYFCGRVDSQVQIRGNRVELGEVERRLAAFPGVAAAAALIVEQPQSDPELAAFVVLSRSAPDCDETALNEFCADALPAYMVPRRLRVIAELPVTGNGKLDRTALAAMAG